MRLWKKYIFMKGHAREQAIDKRRIFKNESDAIKKIKKWLKCGVVVEDLQEPHAKICIYKLGDKYYTVPFYEGAAHIQIKTVREGKEDEVKIFKARKR